MINECVQGGIADTLTWERGRLVPKMELQTTLHLQPIKGGGRWWQMVADNTMHLPPRQNPDTQRVRSYFNGAVADLQIKSKNLFFMTRLNLCCRAIFVDAIAVIPHTTGHKTVDLAVYRVA